MVLVVSVVVVVIVLVLFVLDDDELLDVGAVVVVTSDVQWQRRMMGRRQERGGGVGLSVAMPQPRACQVEHAATHRFADGAAWAVKARARTATTTRVTLNGS